MLFISHLLFLMAYFIPDTNDSTLYLLIAGILTFLTGFLLLHVYRFSAGGKYCSGDYSITYSVDSSREWPLEDRGRFLVVYVAVGWVQILLTAGYVVKEYRCSYQRYREAAQLQERLNQAGDS